jgi:phosphoribosylpyrophosphate synthetase
LNVCIVDNLLVSGATVTEASKVLRRLGAKRIYAAVLARTPPPGEVLRRVPEYAEADAAAD